MNAYTTTGQARIRQRDIDAIVHDQSYLAGACLATLERHRGWQADAEMARLLNQHGQIPPARGSLCAMLRQTLGEALVRAGERLAGGSQRLATAKPATTAETLVTTG